MFDFMIALRFNNSKEFMAAHREDYIRLMRHPHFQLIEALTPQMLDIDPQMEVRPTKALSRIFRDTRFSRDKSPYRDHHWIAFRHAGEPRDQAVMFWFEVQIDSLSWGLGYWGENRPAMDMMRRRMLSHPDDLLTLLPSLKESGLLISGDKHRKMAPPPDLHPGLQPYYALKELYIMRQDPKREWIYSEELIKQLTNDYRAMSPFYRLMRGYYEAAVMEGDYGKV